MARYVVAGIAAGALLVPVELIALGATSFDLIWTVIGLLLALGMVIGALIAGAEWTVERFELGGGRAALVRGATSIPAFVFVAGSLFDGGYAASLPGASVAVYWLPVLGAGMVGNATHCDGEGLGQPGVKSAAYSDGGAPRPERESGAPDLRFRPPNGS